MTKGQKTKETKEEKRTSAENLTGYGDIVCKSDGIQWHRLQIWRDTVTSFANVCTFSFNLLDRVVNFPGCSYEFNVVYVQREKSQYLLYYNNIWSTHVQEQKLKENH